MDVPPPNTRLGSAHGALIDSIRMSNANKDDLPLSRRVYTSTVRLGSSAWHGGFARYGALNNLTVMRIFSDESPT